MVFKMTRLADYTANMSTAKLNFMGGQMIEIALDCTFML